MEGAIEHEEDKTGGREQKRTLVESNYKNTPVSHGGRFIPR